MDYILRLQKLATVLTIGVSFLLLVRLWLEAELHGARGVMLCLWFTAALANQLLAHSPGVWVEGLVAQALLAVVLALKDQMDNIY